MSNKNILVLGNSFEINDLDFNIINKMSDNIVTSGVNRIFLKYDTDYLFFSDHPILNELEKLKSMPKSKIITTDWIFRENEFYNDTTLLKTLKKYNVQIYKRLLGGCDSVTWLIQILNQIYEDYNCIFYVYGVSLDLDNYINQKHFFDKSNATDEEIAHRRNFFKRALTNFKRLKERKFNIISLTPNSKLNDIFEYKDLTEFYNLFSVNVEADHEGESSVEVVHHRPSSNPQPSYPETAAKADRQEANAAGAVTNEEPELPPSTQAAVSIDERLDTIMRVCSENAAVLAEFSRVLNLVLQSLGASGGGGTTPGGLG